MRPLAWVCLGVAALMVSAPSAAQDRPLAPEAEAEVVSVSEGIESMGIREPHCNWISLFHYQKKLLGTCFWFASQQGGEIEFPPGDVIAIYQEGNIVAVYEWQDGGWVTVDLRDVSDGQIIVCDFVGVCRRELTVTPFSPEVQSVGVVGRAIGYPASEPAVE